MIFEVEARKIKQTISFLQSLYTTSEWNKKTSWIELKVKQGRVTITSNGLEPFSFQVTLEGAEPILEGMVRINIRDFQNVLKTFGKDSGTLLFERDAGELRIDDGVYPAEIILLNEENELKDGFSLSNLEPGEGLDVPAGPFGEALKLACQLIRSTFFPQTSLVGVGVKANQLLIRGLNLTEMYEAEIPISDTTHTGCCFLSKADASRLGKFIDRLSVQGKIRIVWRGGWLYVQHEPFLLAFPDSGDQESKTIFQVLPFHEMSESEKAAEIELSRMKRLVSERDKELSIIRFVWKGSILEAAPSEGPAELSVPYKPLQRIISKWPHDRLVVKKGLPENGLPLILESERDRIRHLYTLMSFVQVPSEDINSV